VLPLRVPICAVPVLLILPVLQNVYSVGTGLLYSIEGNTNLTFLASVTKRCPLPSNMIAQESNTGTLVSKNCAFFTL